MVTIDARGMRCPWPAIRLARELRGGALAITVLADDPAAEGELRAVAAAAGRRFFVTTDANMPIFHVDAPGVINPSFTGDA
ncbi:MAG: sulfurtransferase TusA family protein [Sphingomonas sp.]